MSHPKRKIALSLSSTLILILAAAIAASTGQEAVSSRAYVGHENDADMQGLIRQYPAAAGTRLDDCQTCHRGGVKGTDTEREYSPWATVISSSIRIRDTGPAFRKRRRIRSTPTASITGRPAGASRRW